MIELTFTGLITLLVICPVLHEAGHAAAALLTGARVMQISLYPQPSVLCGMPAENPLAVSATACGGLIFPFLTAGILPRRWFWSWYMRFLIQGYSMLSCALSLAAAMGYALGYPSMQEDITKVLEYAPQYAPASCLLLLGVLILGMYEIRKASPVRRCAEQFGSGSFGRS